MLPEFKMAVKEHILIVEDDVKIARALKEGLEREDYSISLAPTGEEAFFLINSQRFDLVLLDIGLPGRSGLEILRAVRKAKLEVPVLVLTARDAVEERVEGLDSGADDYLVKPFAFPELLARIRSLLRRARTDQKLRLEIADLVIDIRNRKVARSIKPIELTSREFEILDYLFLNRGNIVSREMLAKEVWKETGRVTPLDNVIDVHIARLRKKIDGDFKTKLIHTVRGVGFILKEEGNEGL